ncbi:PTS system, mannitol-specific IIA component [Spiroplasma litorale]|uniref:PTS system, mannitol-specific IIA component n=1 Tax=Spiroplasma litorale TaxID=216942 RepID=A0A0K1W2B4_9MOLU|nr:PTS sugar transporter subunit IIA [Spiroplasma litorale]AKX34311.1 PTS system, mannitol-specific IIA component [Spiroplasma litorale]
MKKERQFRIIYILLNYKKVDKTVLMNHFNISQKTINRDIDDINIWLNENNENNENNIIVNDNEIEFFGKSMNILDKLQLDDNFLLKEERLLYIYLTVSKDNCVTKTQLVDDLDISPNLFENDLKNLKQILKKNDINLFITKYGVKFSTISSESNINILIELTINHLLFKKVYSILKLNKIEKLFSNYIYNFLKSKYNINIYNKIFYWILEYTSNQINMSNLNVIILSIKLTFWLNHKNNQSILNKVDYIEYYNEFIETIKSIYIKDSIDILFEDSGNLLQNKLVINKFIIKLINDIEKLFKYKVKINEEIIERIQNHISSNLFITNKDEFILEEYSKNLSNYRDKYDELWNVINSNVFKYFKEFNNYELLSYEIFIHILVWYDSYIYSLDFKILTVCIGGMGQSAMIKNHLNSLYRNAKINNMSYSMINIKELKDYDLVISSIDLSEYNLSNLLVLPILMLLSKKNEVHKIICEKIYRKLIGIDMKNSILKKENIKINQSAKDKYDAIKQCGKLLEELGYIENKYIESMLEREKKYSVYIGNYLAIPHGMNDEGVINDGIVIIHFKDPIDYDSNPVHFFIGIAAKSDNHVEILANIAEKMMDIEYVENLIKNPSEDLFVKEFNF